MAGSARRVEETDFMRDRIIITGVWRVYPDRGIAFNSHNGNAAYFRTTESGIAVWGINVPARWMLKELAEWVVKTMTPNAGVTGLAPKGDKS